MPKTPRLLEKAKRPPEPIPQKALAGAKALFALGQKPAKGKKK